MFCHNPVKGGMTLTGGLTRDEIMTALLQRLGLRNGDVMVDIGCGTGKVAVHGAPCV